MIKLSNQERRVVKYSKHFKGITAWEAAKELGVMRLSAVIYNLKAKGFEVKDCWIEDTNRFGEQVRYKRYIVMRSTGSIFERLWTKN